MLREYSTAEELAALDSSMSAPRMGLSLGPEEEDGRTTVAVQDAPLGSHSGPGRERAEGNAESTRTSPSQSSNAEPRIVSCSSQETPVQAVHTTPTSIPTSMTEQHAAQADDYDAELQELISSFREIERRRNSPPQPAHDEPSYLCNPAVEARRRYYAQQYYGTGARSRGYSRAARGKRKEDDIG